MKTEERVRARELRPSGGWSIKQIARELDVSRSSVSMCVGDIELTEAQRAALHARNPAFDRQESGWLVVAARRREARLRAQEQGRTLARRGDPLHVAGCYADHRDRQQQIEHYWLGLLGLDRSGLCRSIVNGISRSSKGIRLKMLPEGTWRISVNRTDVVQSVWRSIQEYAGFRRDAWLE